jgi:hypothetical protein
MIRQTILLLGVALGLSSSEMAAQSGFRIYHKVTTTEVALTTSYVYYGRVVSVETTHQLAQRGKWTYHLLLGPQIGRSRYEPGENLRLQTGLEVGLKVGMMAARTLSDRWSLAYDISISPHYISAQLMRQIPGFLFEDAASLGLRHHLTETISLDAMVTFRHLSNASLRRPNGGINNLGAGIAVFYQPSRS